MRFRWIIILLTILVSLFHLFKTADGSDSYFSKKLNIKYGLDLQGGIFMQLEVDTDDALSQYIEEQAGGMKGNLETDGYTISLAEPRPASHSILLKDIKAPEGKDALDELKDLYVNWDVKQTPEGIAMSPKERLIKRVKEDAINQTVYKIQNRIDELGVTEPSITRALNSNRIILELAGADDVQRVHNIVKEPGKLEWRLVHPGSPVIAMTEAELLQPFDGKTPPGMRVFKNISRPGNIGYTLLEEVLLTASNIRDVYPSTDNNGMPAVGITLDRSGNQTFSRVTGANVGENLAVVLDGKVISAPTIQMHLTDPRFIITGQFSSQEVGDMVVKIKSGSLPAEVRILEERVIGPTLGRDAIRQGKGAAFLGLALVILFMMIWYRRAGVYSVVALVMNLLLISGMLSALGSVLTLPGIAGFILTIGMAVDANVLVFERIKEELQAGLSVKRAVDSGFKAAYVTILDANITTFLAAFCLLLMGQGPVKGFAVMLMIGIVSSIYTAVFCSRTFFLTYLGNSKHKKLAIWPMFSKNAVDQG